MKRNSNVGVIIANAEGSFFGYSEKQGFFVSKESFFSLKSQEELDDEVVWFTNQPLSKIQKQNIKACDYLDVDIEEILSYLGYSLNQKTLKMVLRKYHDFMLMFVDNILTQFKNTQLEAINSTVAAKRERDRNEILFRETTYKNALLAIGETFKETFTMDSGERDSRIPVKEVYDIERFKESSNKNNIINSIIVNQLKDEDRVVVNKTRSFEYTLLTLNESKLKKLPKKIFFSKNDYEIIDVAAKLKENKDYKKVITGGTYLFFHVKIKSERDNEIENKASFKVLEKLNQKEAIVTVDEYLQLCSSIFLKVKILKGYKLKTEQLKLRNEYEKQRVLLKQYKDSQNITEYNNTSLFLRKIKKEMGSHFLFELPLLSFTMSEEIRLNRLQNYVHSFNYLQIVLLNDNFLLNEWIKSQLLYQNISLVEEFLKIGITVSSYDYKSITLNIDYEEKEIVRELLEKRNMVYPAGLL